MRERLGLPPDAELVMSPKRLSPDWDGNLRVSGTLIFKSSAALKKALDAFESNAYTEFFSRESWEVDRTNKSATIEVDEELPVDCIGFERAFESIADFASEGSIELQAANLKNRYVAGNRWVELLE